MASITRVELIDDLDGKAADETVTFALDGTTYELDLTKKNAEKFRGVFMDYIAAGRKVGKVTGRAGTKTTKTNTKEVRDWARSNGFDVPDRGRIPGNVMEAWNAR